MWWCVFLSANLFLYYDLRVSVLQVVNDPSIIRGDPQEMGISIISKSNWLFRVKEILILLFLCGPINVIKGECMINPDEDGDVVVPNTQTAIPDNAFNGCTTLLTITIPDSVKSIGTRAFYQASELQDIVIPDSVTQLGTEGFLSGHFPIFG